MVSEDFWALGSLKGLWTYHPQGAPGSHGPLNLWPEPWGLWGPWVLPPLPIT